MYLTGFADEASALLDGQISVTKKLGWKNIEARNVEVEGFPGGMIHDIPDAAFDGAEKKTITVKAGPRELTFPGAQYLYGYAIPNFYFHMGTAYNILRSNGVDVGKVDFLGG